MKRIREYVGDDMFNHILMSGGEIRACVNGSKYATPQEKLGYCQGIFTVFPHMMLANFSRWLWEGKEPRPYGDFMKDSVDALQAKAFPVLEQVFAPETTSAQRGALLMPLVTDVIPRHVLTGFYEYMFAGQEDYKDISEFWPQMDGLLALTKRTMEAVYAAEAPMDELEELYVFIGTRLPFMLLKRWYDWQFGAEKLEMPPPPPQD